MKKILTVILCLILLTALIVPASADGAVNLTLKASKTTVYRGDTIDFAIVASGGGTCQSYGFRMTINTDVFELISSSVTDNNAKTLSDFSAGRGLAVGYSSPAVPSGTVCRFTLRVKDTAPLNSSYKLSGSTSAKLDGADVSASGSGVTIKVSCNHSYSGWSKADDAEHQRACSACGNTEKEVHAWDEGNATKEPTCKETGSKEYSCTICSAKKEETLSVTDDHQFASLSYLDVNNHQSICSVCGKNIVSEHVWEMTNLLKKATCKEEGEATYQCTGCKENKTEILPKSSQHTYDHGCDTDCNICGLTRETAHVYRSTWSKDRQNHYHSCIHCGDKIDIEPHTPGPAPTEKNPQTCSICGYILKPSLSHTHRFSDTLTTDETGHWYACSGCDEKKDYAAHDYENACDGLCETCGLTRYTEHVIAEDWKYNEQSHSSYCGICGLIEESFAHIAGAAATEFTAQVCTVCGYELSPALGHAFGKEWVQGEETHYHVCQCGEKAEQTPHTWDALQEFTQTTYTCTVCQYQYIEQANLTWLWILLAVLAVGLVVVIVLIIKKKKKV